MFWYFEESVVWIVIWECVKESKWVDMCIMLNIILG